MFVNEKALVEKLVNDLQEKYGTQYIVKELRSGNNIADIVCATDLERTNIVFDEYYNAYFYFNSIYKHKKICLDEFMLSNEKANRKFYHFLKELEELGYIKIDNNYITTIKKVDAVTKNIIAIEAKLADWRAGLEQAVRYKQYANEVYVALSSENVHKVDRQQFINLNIGLMSVSDGKLKIVIRAKRQQVEKLDVQFYMADRFLRQLKFSELV